MRLYDLIQRLEAIKDRMESTFTNEFLKGEVENLIEELKGLSPEIGRVIDKKEDEDFIKKLKEQYPIDVAGGGTGNPANPWVITYPSYPSGTLTYPSTGPLIFTGDGTSGNIDTDNDNTFIVSNSTYTLDIQGNNFCTS